MKSSIPRTVSPLQLPFSVWIEDISCSKSFEILEHRQRELESENSSPEKRETTPVTFSCLYTPRPFHFGWEVNSSWSHYVWVRLLIDLTKLRSEKILDWPAGQAGRRHLFHCFESRNSQWIALYPNRKNLTFSILALWFCRFTVAVWTLPSAPKHHFQLTPLVNFSRQGSGLTLPVLRFTQNLTRKEPQGLNRGQFQRDIVICDFLSLKAGLRPGQNVLNEWEGPINWEAKQAVFYLPILDTMDSMDFPIQVCPDFTSPYKFFPILVSGGRRPPPKLYISP